MTPTEYIRARIKANGWTQGEVENRGGLSKNYIRSLICNDANYPRVITVKKLADGLLLDPVDLYCVFVGLLDPEEMPLKCGEK